MAAWCAPKPLITCDKSKFRVESETVSLIRRIEQPLVVVCIAGSYRTGKSYLMNRLAGKSTGFALGNTIESKTKGIWVWYVDHPNDPNAGLLLMDTEGLDDPMKGDETNDMQILSLSILLSSTFIYNAVGKIDNSVVDKMNFVTDISKHIKVRSSVDGDSDSDSDSDFDSIFPHFVLVCRDATLELVMGGEKVTADEYMERVMLTANKKALTGRELKRNDTKMKLRRYFPKRKCFFFVRPTSNDEDMLRLEEIDETQLQSDFKAESDNFCAYVNKNSTVKKLDQTRPITGETFIHLVKIFTEAINDNAVPCIRSAAQLVASTANNKLLAECVSKYQQLMSDLELPLAADEFVAAHLRNHKTVVTDFSRKHFLDENEEIHKKLLTQMQQNYLTFDARNREESENLCLGVLESLYAPIATKIQNGSYLIPGGYQQFVDDSEDLQRKYKSAPKKRIPADVVLKEFITKLQKHQNSILQMDQKLTEHEHKLEVEKMRQEIARMNCGVQKAKKIKQQQRRDALLKSHAEQTRALEETYAETIEKEKKEFQKLLEAREKEHKRLLREQFNAEAKRLRQQIDDLKSECKNKNKGIIRSVANIVGSLLSLIPNPLARAMGMGMHCAGKLI